MRAKLLFCMSFLSLFASLTPVQAQTSIPGDVNSSSSVNVTDVVILVNEILFGPAGPNSDLNRDGVTDIADVILCSNIAVGRPTITALVPNAVLSGGLPVLVEGGNFDPAPGNNTVIIDGQMATVMTVNSLGGQEVGLVITVPNGVTTNTTELTVDGQSSLSTPLLTVGASFSIDDVTVMEGSGGGTVNMMFTISLDIAVPDPTRVTVSRMGGGTAFQAGAGVGGDDFFSPNTAINFGPGVTSRTHTVMVNSDDINEADEFFLLSLSNARRDFGTGFVTDPSVSVGDDQGVGMIENDDDVDVTIADLALAEGDSATNFQFTVSLSKVSAAAISVQADTADGSATVLAGDYRSASATLNFAPGVQTVTFDVPVLGDSVEEGSERFFVNLINLTGGLADTQITDPQAEGVIVEDDFPNAFNGTGVFFGTGQSFDSDAGDIDNDGDLDIVNGNGAGGGIHVYLNDGSGGFGALPDQMINEVGPTINCTGVALGDFDSDGDLDAAIGCHGPTVDNILIYENIGVPGMPFDPVPSHRFNTAAASNGIEVGDVDGNGTLDLVVANFSVTNNLLINDGTGSFTLAAMPFIGDTGVSTFDIEMRDLDNDGDLDVVAANSGSPSEIYHNDGTGVFTIAQTISNPSTRGVDLADFDGDGFLDLGLANISGANVVNLYRNNGDGTFDPTPTQSITGFQAADIDFGDLNKDGKVDFVISDQSAALSPVFLNDGAGNFIFLQAIDAGQPVSGSLIRDFNNDGGQDYYGSNTNGVKVMFLNLTGAVGGTFVDSLQSLGTDSTAGVAAGDIDKDGDIDIVEANNTGSKRVRLNDGNGVFSDGQIITDGDNAIAPVLVDIDKDGSLDLVVGNFPAGPTRIFLNDGTGTFSATPDQTIPTGATLDIAFADIDGDGDLDYVAANNGANTVHFNTNGVFGASAQNLGSANTTGLAFGDLDKDGDLDLVTANESGTANVVYFNNGAGSFSAMASLGTDSTSDVVLVDLDKNGVLDVVFSNDGPNTVHFNDGIGNFSAATSFGNDNSQSLVVGDVDTDGDLDVITGNRSGTPDKLYLNDGLGSFTFSQDIGSNSSGFHPVLIDLNGDGLLDYYAVDNSGSGNRVFFNTRP